MANNKSIFDIFKDVVEQIRKEPAKNPSTTTPPPRPVARPPAPSRHERYSTRRQESEERGRARRDERFGRYMRRTPQGRDPEVDAYNQQVIERTIAAYEASRDQLEADFNARKERLLQDYTQKMEKAAEQHASRLHKMVEQAKAGRRIRASVKNGDRYDEWRSRNGGNWQ